MSTLTSNQPARVQVKVLGSIDPGWTQNFPGITMTFDGNVTTLNGILADQSALRGLLCTLWDFNLAIVSVLLFDPEEDFAETSRL